MDLTNLSDVDLLEAIADNVIQEKQAKSAAEPLRKELLRRQVENGEVSISHNGWVSRLKREAFSVAWLKRNTGYTEADLPPECITEKIVPDIDWQKVSDWFQEAHGAQLETTYALTIEREKVK